MELEASPPPEEWFCCWSAFHDLVDSSKHPKRRVSSRMTYLVLDLLELRSLDWCPVRYGARQRREMVAILLPEELRVHHQHVAQ